MTTKISKWGNSYGVRIPKAFLEEVKLAEGTVVTLSNDHGNIQIKPVKKRQDNFTKYTLKELLKKVPKDYDPEIVEWGGSVGNEII